LRPLRLYLLFLVLGALLPGALLTGTLVWRAFANNRAVSERRLIESARVDASALDREFASTIGTLELLATSPALEDEDLKGFYEEGQRVQSTHPGWYEIVLLSGDGRMLLSTRQPWGTPLRAVSDPESLQRLVNTHKPVVGNVRPAPQSDAEPVVAIRVPVMRQNRVKYALSAIVNVDLLARLVPQQLPDSEEWTRTILDSEGTIAVRTRGAEDYVGAPANEAFRVRIREAPESVSNETTREGTRVYAAFSRGTYGWTAVVVVPRAVLDAPLRGSTIGVLTGAALLLLCGLAVVLLVSRRLSTDLATASAAAEAVAEGRPLPRADPHVAETMRLHRSLETAAALLENRARERDEQIRRADAARREAEEANQTKDQFLAVLGHELRNPLAPSLTALELMKARDANVFKREREVLERQVAHMVRLVNDLLDVSRLARGKVHLDRRRFELREAVDRAVDMARPLLAQHRHTLDVSVPASGLLLDADLDRIVQVLSNLLTNAAKYTPPGGRVALVASASADRVVIACEDDGPGIPEDLMPKLFDPFAQGPRALDRREGGLGLGLALARTFTELHGGTISVEARQPQAGSRFVVTLPLAPLSALSEPASPLRADEAVAAQRILVVDDNADACEMLRVALGQAGHELAVAANGPDALAIAPGFRPSVGVLDIGLPGMDGYDLARRLRAAYPRIRLIALTGYGRAGDLEAATAAGFDAHCAKPITTAALLDLIDGRIV
jgi:signal transduction histidine kinase